MGSLQRCAVVLLLLCVAATASCEGISMTDRRPYEYDTPVTQRLLEFHRAGPHGAERRMDEFTDFDWDTVYLFGEGNTYRLIDDTVGTPVFGRDGRYYEPGSLLIFTLQGRVVHAVAANAPLYVGGRAHVYPRKTAVLRVVTQDPGPYSFSLVADGEPPS